MFKSMTARPGRGGLTARAATWLRSPSLRGGLLVVVVLAGCIGWGLLVLGTSFVVAQQGSPSWWLVLAFGLLFLPIALAAAYAIPARLLRTRRGRGPAQSPATALRATPPGAPPLTSLPSAEGRASESEDGADGQGAHASASVPRPGPAAPAAARRLVEPLSRRELEVLELLAAGRSNREIAAELCVAQGTVKAHLNHIFRKLEASSRLQAVAHAHQAGVLDVHDPK